jgi:TRAP-type C4-dicarboxylate transport system permease small subunit
MRTLILRLGVVMNVIARIALWMAGLGLVLMTGLVGAQVFSRYMLNTSIIWSEPGAIILMGWFIFLGAAVGIREGYHLSFDVLLYVVPHRVKMVLFSVSDTVVLGFGVGMVFYGGQMALSAAGRKIPTLGLSASLDFLPLVLGGVLVVLFSLERLARRAVGLPTARFGETDLAEG